MIDPNPQKILILGLNFHPEPTGIGRYTGELAAYLARSGYAVRVITTPPYYPHWQIQAGYRAWQYKEETWQGVEIHRCPLWVPRRPNAATRVIHLASFALSSLPALISQLFWKPAAVLCVAPAFMNAPFALFFALLYGAKALLHIQDFELEAALSLGMLPGGKLMASLARAFERFILTRFNRVSTISENMLALAIEKGVAAEKAILFPNWVDTRQIFPGQPTGPMRSELGIPENKKVILYHGNLGRKQGLEILIEAAASLHQRSDIEFVICGEGVARAELEQKARGLKNVRFLDLQPESRLNGLVNLPDIHVLPQRADAADLVMPSKLTTMLASGKPVIACAAEGTQIWKVVQQVGKVVTPEDSSALAQAITSLLDDPAECRRLGKLGRNYTCQFLEKEVILAKFSQSLQEVCSAH